MDVEKKWYSIPAPIFFFFIESFVKEKATIF